MNRNQFKCIVTIKSNFKNLCIFINIKLTSKYIFISLKMSNRYNPGLYGNTYESHPRNHVASMSGKQYQYVKPGNDRNNFDIKQSNISQQTIIHKAKLYSPDKSQQIYKRTINNSQAYDKTKAKKSQITAKIHQIVDMCESEKDAQVNEFKEVIEAEKRILNMLHQPNNYQESNMNINLTNLGQSLQDRGTTFGPIRQQPQNYQKNQPKQVIQRQNFNNLRQTAARENIYKKSAIDDLKTDRNAEQSIQQNQYNQERQFRPQIIQQNPQDQQTRKFIFNDQTEKMIQQIQRKAMDEIQSLRHDKIQLMKRLNQQIKAHNQQKKLRIQLENQLARLKGQQLPHKESFQNINNYYTHQNQSSQKNITQPPLRQNKFNQPSQEYYPSSNTYIQNETYQNNKISQPQPQTQPHYSNQPPHYSHHAGAINENQYQQMQNKAQQYQQIPKNTGQYQQSPKSNQYQYNNIKSLQNRNLGEYEAQITRLQNQNNNLAKMLKNGTRNSQKQQLRYQISKLNEVVLQYQAEIQKYVKQKNIDTQQLQELFIQASRIQQDGWKIIQRKDTYYGENNQSPNIRRNEESRENIIQDANTFKKKLLQYDNNNTKSNKNIKFGSRKDINQEYRASLPVLSTNQSHKMFEFEKFINQLRSAAR